MRLLKYLVSFFLLFAFLFAVSCSKTPVNGVDGAPGAYTIIFQNESSPVLTYTGCSDASIAGGGAFTTMCYGNFSGATLVGYISSAGPMRRVTKFDISGYLPAATVVTRAYVVYFSGESVIQPSGVTVTAYALTEDWDESEVNWQDKSSGTPWSAAGGTYAASPVSSPTYCGETFTYIEIDASVVQAWVDNPSSNYGILLKPSNETSQHGTYLTNDEGSGVYAPKLIIHYNLK